jgi:hypothetical protein
MAKFSTKIGGLRMSNQKRVQWIAGLRCLVLILFSQCIISCDPADVREFRIQGAGESRMRSYVGDIDAIAKRHGFRPDQQNGTLQPNGLLAAWRRKLQPEDKTTRIACFVYFDKTTNAGRVRLVLFPGTTLPQDTISMLDEVKERLVAWGVSIQPINGSKDH